MGLFGKKETKVAEFRFDKGFEFPEIKPGGIIQMPRQAGRRASGFYYDEAGKWDYEKLKRIMELRDMPRPAWQKPVDDAKFNFIIEMLQSKYRVTIEMEQGLGDYVTFRSRGVPMPMQYALSMTQVAAARDLETIIKLVENGLGLVGYGETPTTQPEDKTKSATESWAEKWAKENENDRLG